MKQVYQINEDSRLRGSDKFRCFVWILFFFIAPQVSFAQIPPTQVTQIPVGKQNNLEKQLDIQIILDFSGSMNALMDGVKKIDAARNALATTLADIPQTTQVSFRVYGNNYSIKQKDLSCKDSTLLIPFGPVNKPTFINEASRIFPSGMTPIAHSLEQAAVDLKARPNYRHMIILISDGEETCEGNPAAVALSMKTAGIDVKIYSIGFGVNDIARQQLQGVSNNTGGKYFDAHSISSLQQSLKQISQETVPKKQALNERLGNFKVKGGDNYETAVPIDSNMLGKDFSFTHHIKKGAPEFFYLDVPAGYTLKVTGSTGEKSVKIDDFNRATEKTSSSPFLYLEVGNFDRKKITSIYSHNANQTKWIQVPSHSLNSNSKTLRYFIVVGKKDGSSYDIHKNSRIKVELIDHTDVGSNTDAAEDVMANPPQIEIDKEYTAHLSDNDKEDVFKVVGFKRGDILEVFAMPMHPKSRLTLVGIFDGFRTKHGKSAYPPNDGAPVRSQLTIPEDGDYYLKFKFSWHGNHITAYKIKVKKLSAVVEKKEEVPTYQPKKEKPVSKKMLQQPASTRSPAIPEEKVYQYFLKKPVMITLLIETGIIMILSLVIYFLIKFRKK